jgi:Tol biopolymer transport system component
MFSPDGRWLAYASNESGRQEVYVRPFPGRGGKNVSSSGGKPEAATQLADGEITHRWPQALPRGKAVLFTAHDAGGEFGSSL